MRAGWRVTGISLMSAENAHQLMQRVKEKSMDLVLLDIETPEVSGFDALRALRDDYSPLELPS